MREKTGIGWPHDVTPEKHVVKKLRWRHGSRELPGIGVHVAEMIQSLTPVGEDEEGNDIWLSKGDVCQCVVEEPSDFKDRLWVYVSEWQEHRDSLFDYDEPLPEVKSTREEIERRLAEISEEELDRRAKTLITTLVSGLKAAKRKPLKPDIVDQPFDYGDDPNRYPKGWKFHRERAKRAQKRARQAHKKMTDK